VTVRAEVVNNRVVFNADGKPRDLVVLQLFALLHEVGIAHLRECQAPDCRRLFVKTYRPGVLLGAVPEANQHPAPAGTETGTTGASSPAAAARVKPALVAQNRPFRRAWPR
jgi:hypothetical protein